MVYTPSSTAYHGSYIPFSLSNITPELKARLLAEPKAIKTSYGCGHDVIEGGNVADPAALMKQSIGHVEYRTDAGVCGYCAKFAGE